MIERVGRNIPIPFSEICIPPGMFSVRKTKNPSKIKLNMIANLFKTNCVCLFLNKNKLNTANAEIPAKNTIYNIDSLK